MTRPTKIAAVLLVLLVAQLALLLGRHAESRKRHVLRQYAVGDTMAPVVLSDMRGTGVSLERLIGGRCRLLVFFSESCGYCRDVAVLWRDRETVDGGVPVTWVSLPEDAERASAFISEYGLPGDWYRLARRQDVLDLGVFGTPMTIMAGAGGVFLGIGRTHPDSISFGSRCGG